MELVDSGSTINAAWIKEHAPKYADQTIDSRYSSRGEGATTPGGHQLQNEGRCRVEVAVEGQAFAVPFQNMRVWMSPYSATGSMPKQASHFTSLKCVATCKAATAGTYLISSSRMGPSWIKMRSKQPLNAEPPSSGFARPGKDHKLLQLFVPSFTSSFESQQGSTGRR